MYMKNLIYFTDASFKSPNEKASYGFYRFIYHDDTLEIKPKKPKIKDKLFNNNNSAELQAIKIAVKNIKKHYKNHFLEYYLHKPYKYIIVTDSDWAMNLFKNNKLPKGFSYNNQKQLNFINKMLGQLNDKIDIQCIKSHADFTEQFKKAYSIKEGNDLFRKFLRHHIDYTIFLTKGNHLIDELVHNHIRNL